MEEPFCVAVRVRPFNSREINQKSKLCISMNILKGEVQIEGPTTVAEKTKKKKSKKNVKKFMYDRVYWSHDEKKGGEIKKQRIDHAEKGGYECTNLEDDRHTNLDIFNDLGKRILDDSFEGYNSTVFVYGQIGSGKSYSMIGYGEDLGLLPMICNELFVRIEKQKSDVKKFKVQVSMIEIYTENVIDLLSKKKKITKGGLKIREHPKYGPYAEGLNVLNVKNYTEINHLMERGSMKRNITANELNQTSSVSHTLFTITLTITEIDKEKMKARDIISNITFVDLAGSGVVGGVTGMRLTERCAINKSLSAIKNVIRLLVKRNRMIKGNKKKKQPFINYSASKLTHLLKERLGGNHKIIMISAISPALTNYKETLSTLRFANIVKQVKSKAVVNEDPNIAIMKKLKKENDYLKNKIPVTIDQEESLDIRKTMAVLLPNVKIE